MSHFKNVCFGSARRRVLLDAVDGPIQLAEGIHGRSAQHVRREAARALEALGLTRVYLDDGANSWGYCKPLLWVELTELGRSVVATFADAFEHGGPVKWPRYLPEASRPQVGSIPHSDDFASLPTMNG